MFLYRKYPWSKSQLPEMEARLQELRDTSSSITRFRENAGKYTEIPELTSEILRIFIKRVEVGEHAKKYPRTALQEIHICYCDIGSVDELPQCVADAMEEERSGEVAQRRKGAVQKVPHPKLKVVLKFKNSGRNQDFPDILLEFLFTIFRKMSFCTAPPQEQIFTCVGRFTNCPYGRPPDTAVLFLFPH